LKNLKSWQNISDKLNEYRYRATYGKWDYPPFDIIDGELRGHDELSKEKRPQYDKI
jgi:hypothetical protein